MLNTYLAIVSHPLFFTFIALCGGVYALLWATSLKPSALPQPLVWLRRHYVSALLIVVGVLFVLAMTFYLVEIGLGVRRLVDLLRGELAKTEPEAEELRFLAHSIGILVAILAGSATIFFASIRVWTNERNTTATEQGLITDRINKAVEGLGAEKTVKERDLERTQPNIEMRMGAITSLHRIVRDSPQDAEDITNMLVVYVRENCSPSNINMDDSQGSLFNRLKELPVFPRADVQTALRILSLLVAKNLIGDAKIDFRFLNFRNLALVNLTLIQSDLRGCDFAGFYITGSDLSDSRFMSSDLSKATFAGTNCSSCRFQKTTLSSGSSFEKSNLTGALFHRCDLSMVDITQEQLDTSFGDKTVIVPKSLVRPLHWSKRLLNDEQIEQRWHAFKKHFGYT
ncbi:hypothetical protein MACH17_16080 [Phaeobacter inhibens]|uniref:pentapeptide repeat-containing protein n=1 Tax=Phaeobacter inhibens TaxID=221822 RepID=UPI002759BD19|nr:pentapeptide repeat-containing protein [Phaeobacter inhibens]GLO70091.1 hypothetical protein MACH17_16080 [Phaeobacter inhibens]